jgi:hypothetical protein
MEFRNRAPVIHQVPKPTVPKAPFWTVNILICVGGRMMDTMLATEPNWIREGCAGNHPQNELKATARLE